MLFWLLAVPVAVVVRSITKEEVFREPREWLTAANKFCRSKVEAPGCPWHKWGGWLLLCKLTYLFTCEFCSSFWISIAVSWLALDHKVEYDGWRGSLLAVFLVMAASNVYTSLYSLTLTFIRRLQTQIDLMQQDLKESKK